MIAAHGGRHLSDQLLASGGIVGRNRPPWKSFGPELPGDHRHLHLHPFKLGLGLGQQRFGGEAHVDNQLKLLGKQLTAESPLACRPRLQLVFEKPLVAFQQPDRFGGSSLQLGLLLGLADEGEEILFVEADRAAVLADRRGQHRCRRRGKRGLGLRHDSRQLPDAGNRIGHVRLLRQRRLGHQGVHAVAEIPAVDPWVVCKRMEVFRQPDRSQEVIAKDSVVESVIGRELSRCRRAKPLLKCGKRVAIVGQPASPCGSGNVVELIVEAMVAKKRGRQRPHRKRCLEKVAVEGLQLALRSRSLVSTHRRCHHGPQQHKTHQTACGHSDCRCPGLHASLLNESETVVVEIVVA